jgi:hypothetical protein
MFPLFDHYQPLYQQEAIGVLNESKYYLENRSTDDSPVKNGVVVVLSDMGSDVSLTDSSPYDWEGYTPVTVKDIPALHDLFVNALTLEQSLQLINNFQST